VLETKQRDDNDTVDAQEQQPDEHYWGQALQYLDRAVAVEPNRKSRYTPDLFHLSQHMMEKSILT